MGNVLKKKAYPALTPADPGYPGQPFQPGYYVSETTSAPNPYTVPDGWHLVAVGYDPTDGQQQHDEYVLVPDVPGQQLPGNGTQVVTTQRWVEPQPEIPARAPSAARYPPFEWDTSAQALRYLHADGEFDCKFPPGVGGVCVGLAFTASGDPKAIQFGMYCHNDVVQAFENHGDGPTINGPSVAYVPTDVWTLRRVRGICTLLKNDIEIYTSPTPLLGTATLMADMYYSYDSLLDPEIRESASGNVKGAFWPMTGVAGHKIANQGVKGAFRPFAGQIEQVQHGAVKGGFRSLKGVLGNMRNYVIGEFPFMTAHIGSGGFIPAPPSGVNGSFIGLQAAIRVLGGGVGGVDATLRHMDGLIGKAHQGKVEGSFLPMRGRIFTYPPGEIYIDSYGTASSEITTSLILAVKIDSTGVASDAWIVEVTAAPGATQIDSTGTGHWDWVVSQVATVFIDSTAYAHDLMGTLVGAGTPEHPLPLANQTVAWVLNLDTSANSRYEDYPYTSFGTRQGALYGTRPDGVYLLAGDDDAGQPILASFATGVQNFADPKDAQKAGALKRIPAVYLGVASDQSLYLKIISGGQEFLYVSRTSNANLMQQRVDVGKGLRSSYYSFEVYNQKGGGFDLESIEFIPVKLGRRIG